jgi:MFS family permease
MTAVDTSGVGFRSQRGPVLIALMVTTGLVAIDATILATAVPSIVDDLGGFAQFPWLFSIYLLAQAVSVPLYAKLSDTVGRKPIILIGVGLFLIGSILCGFAWSLPALIAFRAVQGLGAGAVQPMAITIAGDIYTVAERAKVQGYLASVWAISSVAGPTLGGVFSEFVSWRWIFFINVPLCLVAGWMLVTRFHEKIDKRTHRLDIAGAVLLTSGLSLVILAVLEGGQAWAWDSVPSIAAFAIGGALVGLVPLLLLAARSEGPLALILAGVAIATAAGAGISLGAGRPGMSAVVITTSKSGTRSSSAFCWAACCSGVSSLA